MRNVRPRRIALAFAIGVPHFERVTRGILDYARAHGPWHFAFNPETALVAVASLSQWDGDGVIGWIGTAAEERRAAALGIPIVNLSSALFYPRLPSVVADNVAVGRLAAQHLIERGFRRFAYYGLEDVGYGKQRGAGFIQAVEAAGFRCSVNYTRSSHNTRQPWRWERRPLERWLAGLEPPVGLLAVHDYRARLVLEMCAALKLRVPEDVAVVGVNDDPAACEFTDPTLSSVALPGRDIGHRAAALLDQLMRGRRAPSGPTLIPPTALVARRSTDVLAIEDPTTAEAVRFIAARLDQPFSIVAVADHVGVSRRLLELRFRGWLGCTPHEHISRARVEHAKQLLLDPRRLKLNEVARRCGFTDGRRLNIVFERITGKSPRAYRRAHVPENR